MFQFTTKPGILFFCANSSFHRWQNAQRFCVYGEARKKLLLLLLCAVGSFARSPPPQFPVLTLCSSTAHEWFVIHRFERWETEKKTDTKNQEAKSVLCCGRRKLFYAFLTGYTNISEYTSPRSVARHHVHAFWLNGRLSLCAFVCAEKMLFDAWRAHLFARLIIISCAHIAGCRLENWPSNLLVQRCRTYERIHAQHGTRQQP